MPNATKRTGRKLNSVSKRERSEKEANDHA
jgi:hypothetical protein